MQARLSAALIVAAGAAMPAVAQTAGYPAPWFVYAVTPFCQAWQNGVQACFPVALVGPAPTALPAGLQPLMPTPPVPPGYPVTAAALARPGAASPSPAPAAAATTTRDATAEASAAPQTGQADTGQALAGALPSPPAAPPAALPPIADATAGTPAAPAAVAGRGPVVVLFAFDSDELTADGQDQLAAWLAEAPRDVPVKLTGHADRLGPASYNQALSLRRARSVLRYLTGKGARPNDIRVAGRGEYAPVVRCAGGPTPETKDCLAPNRRVEISLR